MSESSDVLPALQLAAEAIRSADCLLIGAGAGMGVDSGLPDRLPLGAQEAAEVIDSMLKAG